MASSAASGAGASQAITLRPFLDEHISMHFVSTAQQPSVADTPIMSHDIDVRLAKMRRALIAHQALNTMLDKVGVVDLPRYLIKSIEKAEDFGLVSYEEGRWLRHINDSANDAKHDLRCFDS